MGNGGLRLIAGWNLRYRNREFSWEPAPLLVQFAEKLSPGHALDLASGPGRNALYLAQLGWRVTAVDASEVAIGLLRGRAAERGMALDARMADLENGEFAIAPGAYDLICDFFYLQRGLFPAVRAGVRPGGLFLGTIHMFDDTPDVRPRNPRFLLASGELRGYFPGWEILYYAENRPEDGHRRRTAQIAARRASSEEL